jgi:hypothetical protein
LDVVVVLEAGGLILEAVDALTLDVMAAVTRKIVVSVAAVAQLLLLEIIHFCMIF